MLSSTVFSQELTFSKVFDVKGLSKETIRKKALEWFAITYKDSEEVIKMDTEDMVLGNGSLVYDYITKYAVIPNYISYNIKISFKEGKYKLDLDNYSFTTPQIKKSNPISNVEYTIEDAKLNYQKIIAETTDKMVLYALKKTLKSDEKLQKEVDLINKINNERNQAIEDDVLATETSLFNYINKKEEAW